MLRKVSGNRLFPSAVTCKLLEINVEDRYPVFQIIFYPIWFDIIEYAAIWHYAVGSFADHFITINLSDIELCIVLDELKKKLLLHTTYKMYIVSLSFECFYVFIMCIAYGKYARNGLENDGLKTFGN